MPEDKELIRKVAQKDHLAFKMLVDQYQALVLRTCQCLLDDRENAEDVAQEVFFQVYKSAPKFRQDCRVSTWIRRIAINRCLNFNRDNRKFRWLSSLSQPPADEARWRDAFRPWEGYDPDSTLKEAERRKLIREVIASLPEKQRTMLTLHKFEGLSYQEIAEVFETSLPAVEACLHRARVNLQKRLAPHFRKI